MSGSGSTAPRILIAGDVCGRLAALYKRVASVNKSNGPFDALLCVGQFFPSDPSGIEDMQKYIDGTEPIPLPTFFVGNYGEGANLLLSASKLKAAQAGLSLRIAYLGAKYIPDLYQDAKDTNEWPLGVTNGADLVNVPPNVNAATGTMIAADLATELKPRYHFAGTEGVFYAREPYLNPDADHCTRFIGLATVGNDKKQKFLHALSPMPASTMALSDLAIRPPNLTVSPYEIARIESKSAGSRATNLRNGLAKDTSRGGKHPVDVDGQYWRYDVGQTKRQRRDDGDRVCVEFVTRGTCSREGNCRFKHDLGDGTPIPKGACFEFVTKGSCERGADCRYRHSLENPERREPLPAGVCFDFFKTGKCDRGADCRFSHSLDNPAPPRPTGPCWFCLSSPEVSTHLVLSVGDHCYCALAKGPVVQGHVLLLPIEHFPSTVSLAFDVLDEMQKYIDGLRECHRSQGNAIVIFERYIQLRAGTHAHIQIIPIPEAEAQSARGAFETAAMQAGFEFQSLPSGKSHRQAREALWELVQNRNYFYVELPDQARLVHPLDGGAKMSMQFGREVVATLLNKPERGDWKACVMSKDEETNMAEEFKQLFTNFDPML
ncbi:hypothetical protein AXG93_2550s1010 [Marchantia polymorpha subsp. ruderalis]|uniref:C3H1-type domain-containing protein n=1 Tax=Marchantia polymorpha subsp. ruderalis TaxID=1480154 RepID=A0A176VLG0_MARPO|nr:hypothetical protein AXG93_2550s1010 [Marchantia polymorpha subsp. ruderalis]